MIRFIVTLWSPEDHLFFSRREFAYAASDAAYSALLSHRDCLVVETVPMASYVAPW